MLYTETVLPDTLELLKNIQSLDEFSEVRLVGGTALALQIGHRKAIDLDFFGKIDIDIEELAHIFSQFADVQPISSSRTMTLLNGMKLKNILWHLSVLFYSLSNTWIQYKFMGSIDK